MLHTRTRVELQRQPRFLAIYAHPKYPLCDVVAATVGPPKKKRTFRVAGAGNRRMECTRAFRLKNNQGAHDMARAKKTVEVDELTDLEELDDLEGLEDEDEDEAPAKPARKRKGRTVKPAAVEEDDEDEDDEDEEPAPKRSRTRTSAKGKAKGKTGTKPPGPKPLPDGRIGPAEVGKMAGIDGKDVRVFCRRNGIATGETGRYSWTQAQGEKLARRIKAAAKAEKD